MPYDDVSMSVIAKEANVSHGLAFHVFGSKQALSRRSCGARSRMSIA